MTQLASSRFDYIPRPHPLAAVCSDLSCQNLGHQMMPTLVRRGKELYVQNSLGFAQQALHSRISLGNQEVSFSSEEETALRIQTVHRVILRALSKELPKEGQIIDPTKVSIRFVSHEKTEVILNETGSLIGLGNTLAILPEDESFFGRANVKTIHAAMLYLKEGILRPTFTPKSEVSHETQTSPLPIEEVPRVETPSVASKELEREPELDPAAVMEAARWLRGEKCTPLLHRMICRMNQVSFRGPVPHDFPQKITFREFAEGAYPAIQQAFHELLRNPDTEEIAPQTILALLRDWKEAAEEECRRTITIEPKAYQLFLKRKHFADTIDAQSRYIEEFALYQWLSRLDLGGCNYSPLVSQLIDR